MAVLVGDWNVGSIAGFSTSPSRWLDSAEQDVELTGLLSLFLLLIFGNRGGWSPKQA